MMEHLNVAGLTAVPEEVYTRLKCHYHLIKHSYAEGNFDVTAEYFDEFCEIANRILLWYWSHSRIGKSQSKLVAALGDACLDTQRYKR